MLIKPSKYWQVSRTKQKQIGEAAFTRQLFGIFLAHQARQNINKHEQNLLLSLKIKTLQSMLIIQLPEGPWSNVFLAE